MLSRERSQRFYLTGLPLPAPQSSADGTTADYDAATTYKANIKKDKPKDRRKAKVKASQTSISGNLFSQAAEVVAMSKSCTTDANPSQAEVLEIPADKLRVLHFWLSRENPFMSQSALFSDAGIKSGSVQDNTTKLFLRYGLIRIHELQKGKTMVNFWEPTEKAWQTVGIAKPDAIIKGGYLHRGITLAIAEKAKWKKYKVEIESFQANGKAIDLVLRKDDDVICIETAVSEPMEKEITNTLKDFESGLQLTKLVIACKDGKCIKKLSKLIDADPRIEPYRGRIELRLAGDLVQGE